MVVRSGTIDNSKKDADEAMSIRAFSALVFLCLIAIGCGRNERMDTLYAQRCLSCHGLSGQGDGPLSASLPVQVPDFTETVERKSTAQIRRVIAEGRGMMPAFEPALRPSEISDMVQMVRFLSRERREISWWERFDTLVVAHCSVPWDLVLGYDQESASKTP
jgi:Cytochrome C oxidase, cbb3-type, subunit III